MLCKRKYLMVEAYELIIMRHAKSDWNNELLSDFDRPLNNRGMKDAPRMARWMGNTNLVPNLIVSSPALRAKQTASEIIDELKIPDESVVFDRRMYLASTETLLQIIRETDPACKTLMIVGHNPGLENLALDLCKTEIPMNPSGSLLTTANIVHLRLDKTWNAIARNQGELLQVVRPKELSH